MKTRTRKLLVRAHRLVPFNSGSFGKRNRPKAKCIDSQLIHSVRLGERSRGNAAPSPSHKPMITIVTHDHQSISNISGILSTLFSHCGLGLGMRIWCSAPATGGSTNHDNPGARLRHLWRVRRATRCGAHRSASSHGKKHRPHRRHVALRTSCLWDFV